MNSSGACHVNTNATERLCLISEQLREKGMEAQGNRPWKRNDRVPRFRGWFNLTKHVEARDKLTLHRAGLNLAAGYVEIMRSQFDVQFILNGRLLTERLH